jgi:hypothetical protein
MTAGHCESSSFNNHGSSDLQEEKGNASIIQFYSTDGWMNKQQSLDPSLKLTKYFIL